VIVAILPVKSPHESKQRLGDFLPAKHREVLARLLYEQTLETLGRASGIDRVVVATSDPLVAQHARNSGVLVFKEDEQISHSKSADEASLRAMDMGATTALLVPIDVPLVTPDDFSQLAKAARPNSGAGSGSGLGASPGAGAGVDSARRLVIVPSSDGTGTNALGRTPPDVIESRFGPGSFLAHLEEAKSKGVATEVLRLPGLMFDIDTPEDVAEFLKRAHGGPVAAFLRDVCASK